MRFFRILTPDILLAVWQCYNYYNKTPGNALVVSVGIWRTLPIEAILRITATSVQDQFGIWSLRYQYRNGCSLRSLLISVLVSSDPETKMDIHFGTTVPATAKCSTNYVPHRNSVTPIYKAVYTTRNKDQTGKTSFTTEWTQCNAHAAAEWRVNLWWRTRILWTLLFISFWCSEKLYCILKSKPITS